MSEMTLNYVIKHVKIFHSNYARGRYHVNTVAKRRKKKMLKELLKNYGLDDEQVTQFMNDMKSKKIFTASEENLDKRYSKLQADFSTKNQEHQQALDLIEQMKQEAQGNANLQAKITEYETTIAKLQADVKEQAKENAIKMALLSSKAKNDDIDYLMYKLSKDETALKLDENGEITNLKELVENMQKTYPTHFEKGAKKVVDTHTLPDDDKGTPTVTKEQLNKMSYRKQVELFNENPDLYNQLTTKE